MKTELRSSPARRGTIQFTAITVTVLLTSVSALANGGVFNASVVQRTGNLVPVAAKSISLDKKSSQYASKKMTRLSMSLMNL
jgi:hypothetical protein